MKSKTVSSRIYKVLLSPKLEGKAGRGHLAGILSYLDAGHVWDIRLVRAQADLNLDEVKKALAEDTDGFLLSVPDGGPMRDILKLLRAKKKPVVLLDNHDKVSFGSNFTVVRFDTEAIIAAAIHHFDDILPEAELAFVPDAGGESWSQARQRTFAHLMHKAKRTPHIFKATDSAALGDFLAALPKPTGVLAANDLTALRVVEVCAERGLNVPNEIAVLGIDNDEFICGHARPPIATVEPNFTGAGYLAARALQLRMEGATTPRELIVKESVNTLVPRASALVVRGGTRLVADALAFIRENACTINVADVARHLGVSRTGLDTAFRNHARGKSVAEEIREVRFARVLEMLANPIWQIGPIANKCGWKSETHLMSAFRARYGVSMREWRKTHLKSK